jgi:hypothetical protein
VELALSYLRAEESNELRQFRIYIYGTFVSTETLSNANSADKLQWKTTLEEFNELLLSKSLTDSISRPKRGGLWVQ